MKTYVILSFLIFSAGCKKDLAEPKNLAAIAKLRLGWLSVENWGEPVQSALYSGDLFKELPEGKGKVEVIYGKKWAYYRGSFSQGIPHGYGEYQYSSGRYYQGSIQNNQFDGKGRMEYSIGDDQYTYQGEFFHGEPNGKGMLAIKYQNGKKLVYQGTFERGQKHGKGSLEIRNAKQGLLYTFDGEFKNGLKAGFGKEVIFTNSGKEVYEGEFAEDQRNGKGSLKKLGKSGKNFSYEGQFLNNRQHGYSEFHENPGKSGPELRYNGEFKDGQRHGQGTLHTKFPNGDEVKYVGGFANNKENGNSKVVSEDSAGGKKVFEGRYVDGKANGPGILTNIRDGGNKETSAGFFKDGKLSESH